MPGASAAGGREPRLVTAGAAALGNPRRRVRLLAPASPASSLVIVRFQVGEDVERSLVKLNQKLQANFDRIPPGVSPPLIKPRSIDDVPILALTFHSQALRPPDAAPARGAGRRRDQARARGRGDHAHRRRAAAGARAARSAALAARGARRRRRRADAGPGQPAERRRRAHRPTTARSSSQTGAFFTQRRRRGRGGGRRLRGQPGLPARRRQRSSDGAEEPTQYVLFGTRRGRAGDADEEPAVTLVVAKRAGHATPSPSREAVLAQVERAQGHARSRATSTVSITRHYGDTAAEKSNELLLHMAIAVVGVSLLDPVHARLARVGRGGDRHPVDAGAHAPGLLSAGYTLNRITLFALIFSIGILVDDAIVVVENIVRHRDLPKNEAGSLRTIAVEAVDEVGNPTILATLAVIAAILPMAFVGGLMGPYMRPIPVGAIAAMVFSLLVAFVVTPWAAVRLLRSARRRGRRARSRAARGSRHARVPLAHGAARRPLASGAGRSWLGSRLLLVGAMALVGSAGCR